MKEVARTGIYAIGGKTQKHVVLDQYCYWSDDRDGDAGSEDGCSE